MIIYIILIYTVFNQPRSSESTVRKGRGQTNSLSKSSVRWKLVQRGSMIEDEEEQNGQESLDMPFMVIEMASLRGFCDFTQAAVK